MSTLKQRLTSLAEWYESGPKYPVEFEQGRQRIAADIREALGFVRDHSDFARAHRVLAEKAETPAEAAAHIRFAEEHERKAEEAAS
ncbi:MAG: hypothetical protein ACXW27_09005 [Allosphingosinicella sp.]